MFIRYKSTFLDSEGKLLRHNLIVTVIFKYSVQKPLASKNLPRLEKACVLFFLSNQVQQLNKRCILANTIFQFFDLTQYFAAIHLLITFGQ